MMKYLIACLICVLNVAYADEGVGKMTNPKVEIQTNLGTIIVELDQEKAPLTVQNFTQYVEGGFYDGTIFHRVIKDFMIQGGGYTEDGKRKSTREAIRNESNNGLKNVRGTIAMARTGDPHSATSQFFINTKDNFFLDYKPSPLTWGYTVFGKVVKGMEVVDKIQTLPTTTTGLGQDVPQQTVTLTKVTFSGAAAAKPKPSKPEVSSPPAAPPQPITDSKTPAQSKADAKSPAGETTEKTPPVETSTTKESTAVKPLSVPGTAEKVESIDKSEKKPTDAPIKEKESKSVEPAKVSESPKSSATNTPSSPTDAPSSPDEPESPPN